MSVYRLADFGGRFLTTGHAAVNDETYPAISAYVEWFIPENARDVSVTFVHGGGGQGSEFLRTPDNRPGWVHTFVKAGYSTYVIDRPGHGRCVWNKDVLGPALDPPAYELLYPRFVEPEKCALWPEANTHERWPDDPTAGDRFMASQGNMATTLVAAQRHVEAIAPELFELTGRTVLVSHSAGGPCGWALAAIGGEKVAAIIAVEPLGSPDIDHPLGRFENGLAAAPFAGNSDPYARPIVVVTGEATWMRKDNDQLVRYLNAKGYACSHIRLEEQGVTGNGHMMMSELNSDEVASLLVDWIDNQRSDERRAQRRARPTDENRLHD